MSSTRSKSKKNEKTKKITHHKYCDTKVFLIDGNYQNSFYCQVFAFSLDHCSPSEAHYCFQTFISGKLFGENCENIEILLLRNPCTEQPTRYLNVKHLNKIYEILSFSEEPRSWFINDMACSNGNLYMTTVFDPLFFAMYYLRKNCTERAVPLDQAIVDDNFAHTNLLLDVLKIEQLAMVNALKLIFSLTLWLK